MYRRQIIDFIEMCNSKFNMSTSRLMKNDVVVLMQRNSKIIGLCLLRYEIPENDGFDWEAPYWLITVLCVHPSERRRGKASEILDYVTQEICKNNTECRVELDSKFICGSEENFFLKDFFKLRKIHPIIK